MSLDHTPAYPRTRVPAQLLNHHTRSLPRYDDNVDELEQVVRLVQSIEEEEDAMQARKVRIIGNMV